jgi:hypothetical protein
MEKFLLLIREDLKARAKMTTAEFNHNEQLMTRWVESMAQSGNYLEADALHNDGRYVTRDHVLSDGPFIEAKESISGFIVIKAENLAQATSIAQTCPLIPDGTAVVEVRSIMVMPNE